jgi:hypothetical protein
MAGWLGTFFFQAGGALLNVVPFRNGTPRSGEGRVTILACALQLLYNPACACKEGLYTSCVYDPNSPSPLVNLKGRSPWDSASTIAFQAFPRVRRLQGFGLFSSFQRVEKPLICESPPNVCRDGQTTLVVVGPHKFIFGTGSPTATRHGVSRSACQLLISR